MALITLAGDAGCRDEQVARITARQLGFQMVNEPRLNVWIAEEFGPGGSIPDHAYQHAAASVIARLATEHHLVVNVDGAELMFKGWPGTLRVYVTAPDNRRIGNVMIDQRLDRPAAKKVLRDQEAQRKKLRRARFGRTSAKPSVFDLMLNGEAFEPEQMSRLVEDAVRVGALIEAGFLSPAAEAQHQFRLRLQLARHGIQPTGGRASMKSHPFMHHSEQIFANLLDFYRIAWEYEPRSFPIQWDKNGKPLEFFTPDFYMPEFDLYIELTTMKQSLVTKKNRKIKLLRAIYPEVNIQVFYQKDFQDLVFKYGLGERMAPV